MSTTTPPVPVAEEVSAVAIAVEHRRRHLEQTRPALEKVVVSRRAALVEAIDDVAFVDQQLAELNAYEPPTAAVSSPLLLDAEDAVHFLRGAAERHLDAVFALSPDGIPLLLVPPAFEGVQVCRAFHPGYAAPRQLRDLAYPLRVVEVR